MILIALLLLVVPARGLDSSRQHLLLRDGGISTAAAQGTASPRAVHLAAVAAARTAGARPHDMAPLRDPSSGGVDDTEFDNVGPPPLDEDGQPVHAHEGHMITNDDGLFLWYGTGQKRLVGSEWLSDSVHVYTSRDLASWRHKGRAFQASSIPELSVPPPYRIQRVKALYNAERRQYVLLFSLSSLDYALSTVGYATSVSPWGPFKWERASDPDGAPSRDIGVALGDDGAGYLVRSVEGNRTAVSRLRADFLGTAGVCSTAPAVGAPVLFRSGQRWYLLASRHKQWEPAPPLLYVSNGSELCGATWTKLPRPAQGAGGADTTFGSVPAFVHPLRWPGGGELLLYGGDRWNLGGEGGVGNATYIWLPLLPAGGDPPAFKMLWLERWRVGDYRPPAPTT